MKPVTDAMIVRRKHASRRLRSGNRRSSLRLVGAAEAGFDMLVVERVERLRDQGNMIDFFGASWEGRRSDGLDRVAGSHTTSMVTLSVFGFACWRAGAIKLAPLYILL
jgi:hypothetical protein